jgi:hypothetical protein
MGSTGIDTFTHVGNCNLAVTEQIFTKLTLHGQILEGLLIPNFMNIGRTVWPLMLAQRQTVTVST